MSFSDQQYIYAVKSFLAGNEHEALNLLNESDQVQHGLLRARLERRKGNLSVALGILSKIELMGGSDFYLAEVFDQKAQVLRHSNIELALQFFNKAALFFFKAGYVERSLESESNALSISEKNMSTIERYKEWSQLYKKCGNYPVAAMANLLSLYNCAIETDSPEKEDIAKKFTELIKHNINQQDRLVYHLMRGEEAFRNGHINDLRKEWDLAAQTFLTTPITWLKPRFDLLTIRKFFLEGQLARAHALLQLVERRPGLRAKDYIEILIIKHLYLECCARREDLDFDIKQIDTTYLSRFEIIKFELFKSILYKDDSKQKEIEALCMQEQSYSLLGQLKANSKRDFEVCAISRKILFSDGTEKFYRSNSKTFDLLLTLLQAQKSLTKFEFFLRVWGRDLSSRDDENIFYVNMANLKKIIGHEKIISQGSSYVWNSKIPFHLKTGL